MLKQKRDEGEQHQRHQFFRVMLTNDVVDDQFGHARENDHHQRADDGASERAQRQPRVTLQVTKHAPDRLHQFILSRVERRIIRLHWQRRN